MLPNHKTNNFTVWKLSNFNRLFVRMIINTKNLSRARARSSIESTTRVDTLTKRWISFRLEYSKIEYVFWENTRFDSFSTSLH
jgi:hypothetical protein